MLFNAYAHAYLTDTYKNCIADIFLNVFNLLFPFAVRQRNKGNWQEREKKREKRKEKDENKIKRERKRD